MENVISLTAIEERIHDLEAFDEGNCGELPLHPEEIAELLSLKAILLVMCSSRHAA